jgi:hypothetical protein
MVAPDPYAGWSLSDRLQMLAFEAELAHLPRSLIAALWDAVDEPITPSEDLHDRLAGENSVRENADAYSGMLPQTQMMRSATVAYLFPVQPSVERKQAMQFYDLLGDAHVDVSQYAEQATGVALLGSKGVGTGAKNTLKVTVDHHGPHLRLFFEEDFPTRPVDLFIEDADHVWDAFNTVWPPQIVGNPMLTEVKIRMTYVAEGNNATNYLSNRVFHLREDALSNLGRPPQGLGLRVALPLTAAEETTGMALGNASGNLLVETLLEDPARLYIELTATWPAVPLPPGILIAGSSILNAQPRKPGERVREVYNYIAKQVVDFLSIATQ